jgi:hypothetical protein
MRALWRQALDGERMEFGVLVAVVPEFGIGPLGLNLLDAVSRQQDNGALGPDPQKIGIFVPIPMAGKGPPAPWQGPALSAAHSFW